MTITEFLEARIAEDEAEAEKGGYHNASGGVFARDNYGCLLVQPSRVLAESTAKRAILIRCDRVLSTYNDGAKGQADRILAALAFVYREHPDYNKEWTP